MSRSAPIVSPSMAPSPRPPGGAARYRPDIDGLRAVAVVAVLLFHFEVPPFSGGFVGVDVFFVISGYLITAIVEAELRDGRFSVLGFYERRLRRIAPALLAMVLICTPVSLFVFLPGDLRFVGTSLLNAALFTSNILFHIVADDYFAADTLDLTPVLHTWSLSVEAQFYLLYPWLLAGLSRWPRRVRPILLGIGALSFAGAALAVYHAPTAAFYLLPWRAWELLLGALLTFDAGPSRRLRAWQGWLGLAFLGLAILAFDRKTPFPGAAALLPCCGAALLIRAGRDAAPGLVTRLLSVSPVVFVGRISYSLYLWHWPVLVFVRYGRSEPLGLEGRLLLAGLCVGLAMVSWRAVERPFIARALLGRPRSLFVGAGLVTAVAVAAAGGVEQAGQYGFAPRTLPSDVVMLAGGQYDTTKGECRPADLDAGARPPCRFGAEGRAPTVLLWGNSYARMWTPTLDIDAKTRGVAGVSLIFSKCLPLLGVAFPDLPGCAAFNEGVVGYLRKNPALRTVILSANWFVAGARLEALARDCEALTALGVRIVVVLAPPQAGFAVPRTLALAALRHAPSPPPIDEARAREAQQDSLDIIARLRRTYEFTLVDPADRLCDGATCPLSSDGHPIFVDSGHLSIFGARQAAGLFDAAIWP